MKTTKGAFESLKKNSLDVIPWCICSWILYLDGCELYVDSHDNLKMGVLISSMEILVFLIELGRKL
ncbi:hypothetical protein QQP08_024954 [Theobroma cacao]|nr:hypothetical protein QQP08_024954 [Theobroma cacao]